MEDGGQEFMSQEFFHLEPLFLTYLLGLVALLILAVQDYRTRLIDSRINTFMLGCVAILALMSQLIEAIPALIIGAVMYLLVKKSKSFGDGDAEVYAWTAPLMYLINPLTCVIYLNISLALTIVVCLKKKKLPFIPFLTVSYIFSILIRYTLLK